MKKPTSTDWEFVRLGLSLATLAVLASGCVMNDQAESDWKWQQQNPNWKPAAPPDGRPQWGFFSAPDY